MTKKWLIIQKAKGIAKHIDTLWLANDSTLHVIS